MCTMEKTISLSNASKQELLNFAHKAIEDHVRQGEMKTYSPDAPELEQVSGAFVTIWKHDKLRGCIGYIQADKPVYEIVQEMAVAAATRDPRFSPLGESELGEIVLEISVLSPMFRLGVEDVEVGKHGLMIEHLGRRGLLLPKVPVSRGWDREEFLENLCLKAGLPILAWKDEPVLYGFTALEFGEKDG